MFEITLGQAILLYLQYFGEHYGLIAIGLGLIGLAFRLRQKAPNRAKKPLWLGAAAIGLCLCFAGGVKLALPRMEQAWVNREKTLEVLDDAGERFTLDGVTYQDLHLSNQNWTSWPVPEGTLAYMCIPGDTLWDSLYQVPNDPGLDLLRCGLILFAPESQVADATAWYTDWSHFDCYISGSGPEQLLSPQPDKAVLDELQQIHTGWYEELARVIALSEGGELVPGPVPGSSIGTQVRPASTLGGSRLLHFCSRDNLVTEYMEIFYIDGELCTFATWTEYQGEFYCVACPLSPAANKLLLPYWTEGLQALQAPSQP